MNFKRLGLFCVFFGFFASVACGSSVEKSGLYVIKLSSQAQTEEGMGKKLSALSSMGIGVKKARLYPDAGLVCISLSGEEREKVLELQESSQVEWIEPAIKRYVRSESYGDRQWYLKNDGSSSVAEELSDGGSWEVSSLTAGVDLAVEGAWSITSGDSGVVVAVMDTGVDYKHSDLASAMWVNEIEKNGEAGVDDDGNGYIDDIYGCNGNRLFFPESAGDPMDDSGDSGHGTHVAGLIAAADDGRGVVGVAPGVKIMGLRIADKKGALITPAIVEAANYLIGQIKRGVNVRVVNMSFGGPVISRAEKEVIEKLEKLGVLVVVAAGNEGGDTDYYPANYPAMLHCPNIVTVGAIDGEGRAVSFSQRGRCGVDVFAPGLGILSTMADTAVSYNRDYIQRRDGLDFEAGHKADGPDIDGWGVLSGTSMASPLVSGVAALAFSANDELSWKEVKASLLLGSSAEDCLEGLSRSEGFLNAEKVLRSSTGTSVIFDCSIDRSSRSLCLSGKDLDQIGSFSLGGVDLRVIERDSDSARLVLPRMNFEDPRMVLKTTSPEGGQVFPLLWSEPGKSDPYPSLLDYTFKPLRGASCLGDSVYGLGVNGAGVTGLYRLDRESHKLGRLVKLDMEGVRGKCLAMAPLEGKFYLYGGNADHVIYEYDPESNLIKSIEGVSFPLPGYLRGHSMASDGEYVYIAGGWLFSNDNDFLDDHKAVWRWKPGMETWDNIGEIPNIPDGRLSSAMTVAGRKLILAGGYWKADNTHWGELDRVDILDLESGNWTRGRLPFAGQSGHLAFIGDRVFFWGTSNLGNVSPYISFASADNLASDWKVLNRRFDFDGAGGAKWCYVSDESLRLLGESFGGDKSCFLVNVSEDNDTGSGGGCSVGFSPSFLLFGLPFILYRR